MSALRGAVTLARAALFAASLLAHATVRMLPFAGGLAPVAAWAELAPGDLTPLSQFPRERVVIETHSARRHQFDAWRADTPGTREQGLMFVREMRDDQAMIFLYQPPAYVSMWMKNTLIPLDMLFVNQDGCVINIKHDAEPRSLATISSGGAVALVVELNGGVAARLGIMVGDRVQRPDADWPDGGRS